MKVIVCMAVTFLLKEEWRVEMTNREKIQKMNTEELAFLLAYFSTCDHCVFVEEECERMIKNQEIKCEEGIARWLGKEVETQK